MWGGMSLVEAAVRHGSRHVVEFFRAGPLQLAGAVADAQRQFPEPDRCSPQMRELVSIREEWQREAVDARTRGGHGHLRIEELPPPPPAERALLWFNCSRNSGRRRGRRLRRPRRAGAWHLAPG